MKSVFLAIATIISLSSFAGNDPKIELPVELKYVGQLKNSPVFQINLTDVNNVETLNITIKDDAGNTLYNDNVKNGSFSKKFMLTPEQTDEETIRVDVTAKSGNKQVSYLINTQTRQIVRTSSSKF
jgi:hypothetical protein